MKNQTKGNWHVVYTFPNAEKKINNLLLQRNLNVYLPLHQVDRQWSRGIKKMEVPLFPNYIFVNITPGERGFVLGTPGVVKFVTIDGSPSIIKEREIDSIKAVLSSKYEVAVEPDYGIGDGVEILYGSLQGMEGILTEEKGGKRFLVNLKSLNKTLSVNISGSCLSKLKPTLDVLI